MLETNEAKIKPTWTSTESGGWCNPCGRSPGKWIAEGMVNADYPPVAGPYSCVKGKGCVCTL